MNAAPKTLEPRNPADLPDLLRVSHGRRDPATLVWGISIAAICFVLGIVGWLIPVITGIPFYVAGAVALALCSRRVQRFINRWDRRRSLKTRLRIRRGLRKVPLRAVRRMLVPYNDPRDGPVDVTKEEKSPGDQGEEKSPGDPEEEKTPRGLRELRSPPSSS